MSSLKLLGNASVLNEYLADSEVTDILINGLDSTYIDRAGTLCRISPLFSDARSIRDLIERLVLPIGRQIDASKPYIDGRLSDGSRFHIILPPLAPTGPLICIRKFGVRHCILKSVAPAHIVEWLEQQVRERKNILIAGGTGSGKTTLLSTLIERVPSTERIVVVEETREIDPAHPHVLNLEARPANPDGLGEVSMRTLLKNTLRMRPDRVVVGECRGTEAWEMVQAMSLGHPGSLSTIHASSAWGALRRLETLLLLAHGQLSVSTIKEWVAGAIDVVVMMRREAKRRKIEEILIVEGSEGHLYRHRPFYRALDL